MVVGNVGDGWKQVVSELAFERSGPERFLSTFVALHEALRELARLPNDAAPARVGGPAPRPKPSSPMSSGWNGSLQQGKPPLPAAALHRNVGMRSHGQGLATPRA